MMQYKLTKKRGGILEVEPLKIEFEDTFSSIHLRQYYIDKYKLVPPCRISKETTPGIYDELLSLISRVNLFKPREEVPNKRFTTDLIGPKDLSKLVRKGDKSRIDLCFRAKKSDGTLECSARTPNTCFISERDSWICYRDFYSEPGYNSARHYIDPSHPAWKYWNDYMDNEYVRLTGVKYSKLGPRASVENSLKEIERCFIAYSHTGYMADFKLLKALAKQDLCKINDIETSLYDKEGYWICELEEFINSDPDAFMLESILSRLTDPELSKALTEIEAFIEYPEEFDIFSVFNNINN